MSDIARSVQPNQMQLKLFMLLGSPGSGKSYFARQLALKLGAVRINGDAMRLAIFGSREEVDRIYEPETRNLYNGYVFRALDYSAEQILLAGHSVVFDANNNKRVIRTNLEKLAKRNNAIPIVIQINTPYDVAFTRGQSREESLDQRQFSAEKMKETMNRIAANTDAPGRDEQVIEIDGQATADQQWSSFTAQLATMLGTIE